MLSARAVRTVGGRFSRQLRTTAVVQADAGDVGLLEKLLKAAKDRDAADAAAAATPAGLQRHQQRWPRPLPEVAVPAHRLGRPGAGGRGERAARRRPVPQLVGQGHQAVARAPGCSHRAVAISFDTHRRHTAPRRSHKLQPDEVGASVRAIAPPHAKEPCGGAAAARRCLLGLALVARA
eukprot:scaffold20479_cov68-Phaeocystis_antarctica.AAC.2